MKNSKRGLTLLLALCVVLALAACGGKQPEAESPTPAAVEENSAEGVAVRYMTAVFSGDIAGQLDVMPQSYVDTLVEEYDCESREELVETLQEETADYRAYLVSVYGEDYEVYVITEETQEVSAVDLDNLRTQYESQYDLDKLQAGALVYVRAFLNEEGLQESVNVVKIDGQWYVDVDAMEGRGF